MPKDEKGIWGTLGAEFFSFSQKNMDEEEIYDTLGDALRSFSLCMYMVSAHYVFIYLDIYIIS